MTTKRLCRNGNSQAVRIPAELAYELRISPTGRQITAAPIRYLIE